MIFKLNNYIITLILILVAACSSTNEKTAFDEYCRGTRFLNYDKQHAKIAFQKALLLDSSYYNAYHFIADIYLEENKPDSAINCYKNALRFHPNTLDSTRVIMFYDELIDIYLIQHDFQNAFNFAWEAYLQYENNDFIERKLREVCFWAFYVNHGHIDPNYLSTELKDVYIINSNLEEYLIINAIKIKNNNLYTLHSNLIEIDGDNYSITTCMYGVRVDEIDVKFKLNWDIEDHPRGIFPDGAEVSSNSDNPVYDRVGALLVSNGMIDLKKTIKNYLEKENK